MSTRREKALDAAMKAFHKGPPGVVRRVVLHDSTPPDYERIPSYRSDTRLAIADAVDAYIETIGLALLDSAVSWSRWGGFSDDEVLELASLVSAADESYDLSVAAERLSAEVKAEVDNRQARGAS